MKDAESSISWQDSRGPSQSFPSAEYLAQKAELLVVVAKFADNRILVDENNKCWINLKHLLSDDLLN